MQTPGVGRLRVSVVLSEEEAYLRIQRQARQERRTKLEVAEVILRQARDD